MEQSWAEFEFGGARLGDQRQVPSVQRIAGALAEHPNRSFTAACGSAARQAAHRIFEHEDTTIPGLLAGHFQRTRERCAGLKLVLIAQDTCFFVYKQEQITGLARINQSTKARALIAHGALAMTPEGTPLGLLHLDCWGEDLDAPLRLPWEQLPPAERESAKWGETFTAVSKRLPDADCVLLIADREADITAYLTQERPAGLELLVRAAQDRVVYTDDLPAATAAGAAERTYLFQAAAQAPVWGRLEVRVPRKEAKTQHVLLLERLANLEVRVGALELRPRGAGKKPTRVWVVSAVETDPPTDAEAIHWVLLSTFAVPDLETACAVVGYYARRWLIERLHYTLKSGLRAERLQIDDARSLGHALAIYYVVAWRLLHLTYLAREHPDEPAATVLEAVELEVLAAATRRPIVGIHDAVLAIAELGGWQRYRTAPPPGVKSLWVGWITLQGMVQGYLLAQGKYDPEVMILG